MLEILSIISYLAHASNNIPKHVNSYNFFSDEEFCIASVFVFMLFNSRDVWRWFPKEWSSSRTLVKEIIFLDTTIILAFFKREKTRAVEGKRQKEKNEWFLILQNKVGARAQAWKK